VLHAIDNKQQSFCTQHIVQPYKYSLHEHGYWLKCFRYPTHKLQKQHQRRP